MGRPIATLSIELEARMAKFESDLKRANRVAYTQSRKMEKSVKRAGKNMVRALGIGGGVAIFTAGMRASVTAAVEFEKAMDEVSTLVGDTTNMDKLTDSVRDMSREFGKAPVEEAKALYQIISAGAETAAEQMSLLTASNKLAIGGVTEVAIAADGLTTVLNAYSLEASQATDISDLLFVGMKQGKTTIEEMATSIGKVATIAAQTGVPIDELVAGVATLTKSGIGTAEAMSGLQGVLSAVLKQSPQSVAAAEELGVAFNAQALEAKGLAGFLNDIQVAADGDAEKLQKLFGRVEGLTAVMSLGANGAKEFNSILEATGKRAGATDEAFAKMAQGSAFQMDKLKVSLTLVAEAAGSALLPAINSVADSIIRLIAPVKSLAVATTEAAIASRLLGDSLRSNAVENYQSAIDGARLAHIALDGQIEKLRKKLILIEPTYHKGHKVVEELKDEIKDLQKQQAILVKGIVAAKKALKDNTKETETNTRKSKIMTGVYAQLLGGLKLIPKQLKLMKAEADKLNDTYNNTINTLFPLLALERDHEQQLADIETLHDSGAFSTDQYNEALKREAKAFEDATHSAMGLDTELEYITVTAKRMTTETTKDVVGMAAVIENSFKRLDDTFAGFWENIVKNGKISLTSIKDLFLDTIAQLLHAAITQPIVLRIGAAMTGGLASGAASAASGGLGGALGGGLSGTSGLLGLAGVFGGNGIGQMFASAPGAFGNLLGAGANLSNAMFGLAGVLGGIGGQLLFGGQGGLGGSIGAVIGTAILPGIGSVIGGLIGGFIGGLFGGKKTPKISAGNLSPGDTQFFDSLFGGIDVGKTKGGMDELVGDFGNAISSFDNALASFMNDNQIDKVTDALSNWAITLKGDAATIENILESRFSTILSTFGSNVQEYVNQFAGLEAQTEALGRYVSALNLVGMAVTGFVNSNPAEILAAQLENAARNSTDKLSLIGDAMTEAFASFDNTPEALVEIAQLVDLRYRAELEYLAAIDQLVKGISASIEAQQTRIREAIEGPKSFDVLFADAQALLASISGATSPEELAQIVGSIQSLVDKAFGGLDENAQAAQADSLIAFLDQVQAAATQQADVLAQMVIDQGMLLREQSATFAEAVGIPLELNIQATQDVGAAVNSQTTVIVEQHTEDREQQEGLQGSLDELNANIQLFLDAAPR